jgi:large subunit ribosomal protein L14e
MFAQAVIEGPSTGVPRQSFPFRHLTLTTLVVPKLPRAAGSTAIKAALEKAGTLAKWEKSAWAQKRAAVSARRGLSDFDRFKVMLAKKQRRDAVNKSISKA